MKFIRTAFTFAAIGAAVSAHAETVLQPSNARSSDTQTAAASSDALTGKKEAAYTCRGGDKQTVKLTAMYGLQGNDVVVAQVKVGGQISPGMWRVSDNLMNRFVSNDPQVRETMWTTWPADAQQVTQVDGGKLSYAEKAGSQHTIIVENCKLDKAETARLNR